MFYIEREETSGSTWIVKLLGIKATQLVNRLGEPIERIDYELVKSFGPDSEWDEIGSKYRAFRDDFHARYMLLTDDEKIKLL